MDGEHLLKSRLATDENAAWRATSCCVYTPMRRQSFFPLAFIAFIACLAILAVALGAGEGAPARAGQAPAPTAQASGGVPSRPPASAIRADLERILAKPEYATGDPTWLQRLEERIVRAIAEALTHDIGFARLLNTAPVLYWTLVAGLVAILLVILYYTYLGIRATFGPTRVKKPGTAAPPVPTTSPRALRSLADEAAGRGDFEQALRYLYLAVLRQLDRTGVLGYQRARTNWEYVDALRGKIDVAPDFVPLTLAVDRVTYGRVPAGADDYTACSERVERIWGQARPDDA